MANELQTQQLSPLAHATAMLAANSGLDIAKLREFFDLQKDWEANEARKAYVEAMAAFKANPPEIIKDKHVAFKDVKYDHASLANVCNTINQALSQHGLTAAWVTEQGDKGGITVTCTITHIFGHKEQTSLTALADKSGSKNDIQAIGSTVTYLQRYTILALTGLATAEQDDDGKGADDRPPQIPDPTEAEQKCIDEICKYITPPAGMKVSPFIVGRILWVAKGKYPSDTSKVQVAAKWLVEKKKNVYVPDDSKPETAEPEDLDLLKESLKGMTQAQKEQMQILHLHLQEVEDAEPDAAKIDKMLLAGWVLEMGTYPGTAAARQELEQKVVEDPTLIKKRLIAKAAA